MSEDSPLVDGVREIIRLTQLVNVRTMSVQARNERNSWPGSVQVRVAALTAEVNSVPGRIQASFMHEVTYTAEPEELTDQSDSTSALATISCTHVLEFKTDRDLDWGAIDSEVKEEWLRRVAYFIVYPYVRETIQRSGLELGIPVLVLGYLTPESLEPSSLTVIPSPVLSD